MVFSSEPPYERWSMLYKLICVTAPFALEKSIGTGGKLWIRAAGSHVRPTSAPRPQESDPEREKHLPDLPRAFRVSCTMLLGRAKQTWMRLRTAWSDHRVASGAWPAYPVLEVSGSALLFARVGEEQIASAEVAQRL
eukprot:scaffold869_cov303-Pinguiococcus_pyrenoidosus.AAC.27